MTAMHGKPCWYELGTRDLAAATAFYGDVLGWQVSDSGMAGFTYLLARAGDQMIAGMMSLDDIPGEVPPYWLIYFGVDDCDAVAAQAVAAGGQVLKPSEDVPGTGRFAVLADPQGAVFGVLQPDMGQMSAEDIARAEAGGPFDPSRSGHGHWQDLSSTDPIAGFAFYAALFGWTKGDAVPMQHGGAYQLFRQNDRDIGGISQLMAGPMPYWLAYFGVDSVGAAVMRIEAGGGVLRHGPVEVPGGDVIAIATDPQGAAFAVVGPQ